MVTHRNLRIIEIHLKWFSPSRTNVCLYIWDEKWDCYKCIIVCGHEYVHTSSTMLSRISLSHLPKLTPRDSREIWWLHSTASFVLLYTHPYFFFVFRWYFCRLSLLVSYLISSRMPPMTVSYLTKREIFRLFESSCGLEMLYHNRMLARSIVSPLASNRCEFDEHDLWELQFFPDSRIHFFPVDEGMKNAGPRGLINTPKGRRCTADCRGRAHSHSIFPSFYFSLFFWSASFNSHRQLGSRTAAAGLAKEHNSRVLYTYIYLNENSIIRIKLSTIQTRTFLSFFSFVPISRFISFSHLQFSSLCPTQHPSHFSAHSLFQLIILLLLSRFFSS